GDLAINQAAQIGTGNLTLNVTGNVTQNSTGVIIANGLQLTGSGSVHLDNANNDVTTLAANFNGPLSYTDKNGLTVGIVADTFSSLTSTGITSSSHDVKLTTGGDLAINQAAQIGTANLTLNVTGNVTQGASGPITASGLQLTGSGSVHLDNANNDVTTLAANFNGPLSYTDKNGLTVGIVADTFSSLTSTGITSSSHDVKLTTGGDL